MDNKENKDSSFHIAQKYDLKEHIYATRTSEASRAVEIKSGDEVIIWTLRYPLAPNSDAKDLFQNRMKQIHDMDIPTPEIYSFGIDSNSKPFMVTEYVKGKKVINENKNQRLAASYFFQLSTIVSTLHKADIVLGDISEDSFIIDENENLQILTLMGSFKVDAAKTAILPKNNTLNFLSPEQKTGVFSEPYSDVYALGIFGYKLFTGNYPEFKDGKIDTEASRSPSVVHSDLPIWVDDVIGGCLVDRLDGRYKDASKICEAINKSMDTGMAPGGMGCWSRRTMMVRPETMNKVRSASYNESGDAKLIDKREGTSRIPPHKFSKRPKRGKKVLIRLFAKLSVIGLLVGLVLIAISFLFLDDGLNSKGNNVTLKELLTKAKPNLQKLGNDFIVSKDFVERRKEILTKIAKSEDDLALKVLAEALKESKSSGVKIVAEKAILERVLKSGLESTASILAKWFDIDRKAKINVSSREVFPLLMKACDVSEPVSERREAVTQAYPRQPKLSIQIAAALAFDTKNQEEFSRLLRDLLAVELERDDISSKSTAALVLTYKPLSIAFKDYIDPLIQSLSVHELAWCLSELVKRDSLLIFKLAKEAISRDIVPPYQKVFLSALLTSSSSGMPSSVRKALVNGARNKIQAADIRAIGRWYSTAKERPLLSICSISNSSKLSKLAFDTLSPTGATYEPAKSLIKWLKQNHWKDRGKLVKPVCILSISDIASNEEIDYAFNQLMPYAGFKLVKYIIRTKDSTLLEKALDRFAELASNDLLLSLLTHKEPRIRARAVKGLKGRNNLNVIHRVLKEYQKEEDPRVKAVYKKYHFVVRDRDTK